MHQKKLTRLCSVIIAALVVCSALMLHPFAQTPDDYAQNLLFSAQDMEFPQNITTEVTIPDSALEQIKTLDQGTVLVRFTPQGTGIQSLLGISNSQAGFPNSYFNFYISAQRLGFEIRQQAGGDYEKKYANVTIESGKEYYAAITADPEYGYRLFLNGEQVLDWKNSQLTSSLGYGFIGDIEGIDSGTVGKTKREDIAGKPAANQYPYYGTMQSVEVYDCALPADYLIAETAKPTNPTEPTDPDPQPEEDGLVFTAEQMEFPSQTADGIAIPQDKLDAISALQQGTILTKFTPQISGIHSLIGISDGTAGFANSHFNLYLATGKVGFEIRQQNGGDYQKSSVNVEMNSGEEQYLALTADPNYGYKLFLNGQKILDLPNSQLSTTLGYGFISNVPNVNAGFIGKTKRTMVTGTVNEYKYYGSIASMQVYDHVLTDEYLTKETGTIDLSTRNPVRKFNLFNVADWNSPAFRIPSMITTDNDVVIAAADIRFGNSNDSPNNIDIGILTSKDNGETWSQPKLILNFLDYPNLPTAQITNSASFIDSVMVKGDNNRVFLFVDVVKGGVGQANAIASSGYTTVNNEKRLILKDASGNSYTVGSDNVVYDSNQVATEYTVGPQFALLKNGSIVSNIFYANAPLSVLPTTFVCMIYSDDDGQTWSDPKLMDQYFKTEDMKFFGVAPGIGIQIQNGDKAGRLIVPMYYTSTLNTTEFACVVYSDDNGETWKRGASPNDNRIGGAQKLHESQIIEMPDGQLKMYARSLSKASVATSFDGGETWHNQVEFDNTLVMSSTTGCQLSIINYSQPINGKPAVIFSNPAATARKNGTVRVGLIEEDGVYSGTGTQADGRTKYRINWVSSKVIRPGEYAYSCLTELPNHNIANLYEENNTKFTLDHLVYAEYTLKFLMGNALQTP